MLLGTLRADTPLIVAALREEAECFHDLGCPVLITGVGKVRAATVLARTLAAARPSEVVNLGTAGALHAGLAGTHVVGVVAQHDFDHTAILELTGHDHGSPITLGTGVRLATGDAFVRDEVLRDHLARGADLVDMEGYAVAHVAREFGVPVTLVKHVSDEADGSAARSWTASVQSASRHLAAWYAAR